MAAWSTLTAAQQQQVQAWMQMFRSSIIELVTACNHGASLDGVYQNGISSLVSGLDLGTVIPDTTSLAGAQPLTREDVINTMTLMENLLTSANTATQRSEYLKIVGPPNMTG